MCSNDVSLLPWQQGWSDRNLNDTVRLPVPENPLFAAKILHVSLTVPELWLFEVAIGRYVNFQILGVNGGKFQFFLTKPYKECECHQNTPSTPLTAIIGPTDRPVAMSMKLKKNQKNRCLTMTISRMRRHTPLGRLIQIFACGVGSLT